MFQRRTARTTAPRSAARPIDPGTTAPRPTAARTAGTRPVAVVACGALLLAAGCGSDASDDAASPPTASSAADSTASDDSVASATSTDAAADTTSDAGTAAVDSAQPCEEIAALFVTRGSANADLDDPEVSASCVDGSMVVNSNGIPDYPYVETSPGIPTDQGNTFTIPAVPVVADTPTDVPLLGEIAVTLGGLAIYGPTEGTGGDVGSLPGALSECGSHNGPTGFHIHQVLTPAGTDCLFTPEEVAAEPQLVGYAFDGFPIYTGADQYTSSWELTDESLFATDTWAAHTYVEGAGDLDQCNGRSDEDGNYAYYTTATFPYALGCYTGIVDVDTARGATGRPGAGRGDG